jgi:hypothetical protein
MRVSSKLDITVVASAMWIFAGCGSSSHESTGEDAAVDMRKIDLTGALPDLSSTPDIPIAPDSVQGKTDALLANDSHADAPPAGSYYDAAAAPFDAAPGERSNPDLGAGFDGGSAPDAQAGADVGASPDAAPDGFVAGPATAIVVNSSNTASYSLADGTWKVFYFDATAGQIYCVSELSGITRGYVSTSPSVSPADYQYATSPGGTLAFRAANSQRHYIAVAVSGGGASGSFQVADGGQLLAIGANTVTMTANAVDTYYFFRFPIVAGHTYSVSITGTSTTSVGLGLSPKAERASNGQFSAPLRGVSGPLPINSEAIPADSVAQSYSGYYFLFLRVYSTTNATVTITQTS